MYNIKRDLKNSLRGGGEPNLSATVATVIKVEVPKKKKICG